MQPPIKEVTPSDLAWAKEAVKDCIWGCVLNIKLYEAGICSKYLCNMTVSDIKEYVDVLQDFTKS